MMRVMAMAVAAAVLTWASPAAAQQGNSAADVNDMQCIAVFSVTSADEGLTPEQTNGLAMGLLYYLGRLQGRSAAVDWYPRLTAFILDLDWKDLEGHFERCGSDFETQGAALEAWGKSLAGKTGGKS